MIFLILTEFFILTVCKSLEIKNQLESSGEIIFNLKKLSVQY